MLLSKIILIVGNGSTTRINGRYFKDQHTARFLKDLNIHFDVVYWLEQVVSATSMDDNLHSSEIDEHIKLINKHHYGCSRLSRVLGLLRILYKYIVSVAQVDFVYFYFHGTLSFLCALIAIVLNKPYGLYVRCDFYARSIIEKLIVRNSAFIMVVGDEFKQRLMPYSKRIFQVSPMIGFSSNEIKERAFYNLQIPKLLFVGRIEEAKGVYVIIDALNVLNSKGIDFEFNFVGGGSALDDLKKQSEYYQLNSKVIFHGLVGDKMELSSLYDKSDLFIFASFHEGFPRVLYEAMSHSMPIITTRVGSIPSLMHENKNCLMVKDKNFVDLAEKIELLIQNRELRENIGIFGAETLRSFLLSLGGKTHADQIVEKIKEFVV